MPCQNQLYCMLCFKGLLKEIHSLIFCKSFILVTVEVDLGLILGNTKAETGLHSEWNGSTLYGLE